MTHVAIPGVTIDTADGNANPVVTSVRSDSEAERRGVRAGDDIIAVDGHPVSTIAAVRTVVLSGPSSRPLDLHIRRGDAMWDVSLDRAERAAEQTAATETVHVTENLAD
jgi:C-terminal processing protease CtpA/Prc